MRSRQSSCTMDDSVFIDIYWWTKTSLYRLPLGEGAADPLLYDMGAGGEVFLPPAPLHRRVIGPLGLFEHGCGHVRRAREGEGEASVLAHQLAHEGRRELAVEDALGAAIEVGAERHAAAVSHHVVEGVGIDTGLHAHGECFRHRH